MRKKSKIVSETLPIEIFYHHIFIKLPVKSLLRFKCVCREWNNILSDPQFVRMQATQQNYSHRLLLYTCTLNRYYSLDHQKIGSNGGDDVHAVMVHFPLQDIPRPIRIVGSVNGLVCLAPSQTNGAMQIIVWNPSTRDYKVIPPHLDVPIQNCYQIGFGYDSIADDYKIVHIAPSGKKSRIDIYSLKTKSWKLVIQGGAIPNGRIDHKYRLRVSSVDGSIYWSGCRDDGVKKDEFIACFDLKEVDDDDKEKKKLIIRELPMPGDYDTEQGFTDLKMVGGGCLGLCKVKCNKVVMWTMKKKEDNDEYRWSNKVVMMITEEACNLMYGDGVWERIFLLPKCMLKDGKVLLAGNSLYPGGQLVLYDPEIKSIKGINPPIHWISKIGSFEEDTIYIDSRCFCQDTIYIETLVSPN